MKYPFLFLLLFGVNFSRAQYASDAISSGFVLYQQRVDFDRYLREKTIDATFAQPLDGESEDYYREACWAISQYLLRSAVIEKGFRTMLGAYATLQGSTKRALLEAVYGAYPVEFGKEINALMSAEQVPKLFAMQALYLYRLDSSNSQVATLLQQLQQQFAGRDTLTIFNELKKYVSFHRAATRSVTPPVVDLFAQQKLRGHKMIYSFQRWNRDYPGLALVQNADGSFCRDSSGRLLLFEQLARSASDLPYFITNGSTPQGIYSIQGTAVSHNNLIGPTPNLQLLLPNEADSGYWHDPVDSTLSPLQNYLLLLPPSWQLYEPVREAFYAGMAGRSEIIAHGSAIDPEYFKDKSYYPLTPTMGCLAAKEDWNPFNGRLNSSAQLGLVNTFLSTPGNTGYLVVINLDNLPKAVSREEIEALVAAAR